MTSEEQFEARFFHLTGIPKIAAWQAWQAATAVAQGASAAEIDRLRNLLNDALITMRHAETFISSREKMHPTGQHLYRELMELISKEQSA